jgi:hypothetical protein
MGKGQYRAAFFPAGRPSRISLRAGAAVASLPKFAWRDYSFLQQPREGRAGPGGSLKKIVQVLPRNAGIGKLRPHWPQSALIDLLSNRAAARELISR